MKKKYLQASGEDWEKARMRALVRDDFSCQAHLLNLPDCESCSASDPQTKLRKLQVHHKKFRINGGTHDLDNLITICYEHHMMIHPHMRFELPMAQREFEMPMKEFEMEMREI